MNFEHQLSRARALLEAPAHSTEAALIELLTSVEGLSGAALAPLLKPSAARSRLWKLEEPCALARAEAFETCRSMKIEPRSVDGWLEVPLDRVRATVLWACLALPMWHGWRAVEALAYRWGEGRPREVQ